jgi:hypothetical protein
MSVLQRKLFNRGGSVARGTGITSGLINTPKRGYVDGPGSYAGMGEENLPTGTAGLFDTGPVPAGKILDAGAPVNTTSYTSNLPTVADIVRDETLPLYKQIYGEGPAPMTTAEKLAPYILQVSQSLLAGKSKKDGAAGFFDIVSDAFASGAPALNQALGVKRQEDKLKRAEEVEVMKLAISSAEDRAKSNLTNATSLENTRLKNNAPKIGDTKFLVKKGSDMIPSSVIAAYEAEETINGRRIKVLRDFDGKLLTDEYVEYDGAQAPKDFAGTNAQFTIGEGEDAKLVERMIVGRFEKDPETNQYNVKYYYKDDNGDEQEVPGDAVITSRAGEASEVGTKNADRKQYDMNLENEIGARNFIDSALNAFKEIKKNPSAVTDIGDVATFFDRIKADAQAIVALAGGTFEIDEDILYGKMDDLGLAVDNQRLRSIYLDLAISRAVFKEGGTRVTDRDVINQLRIIGAYGKSPEAALVLLRDFIAQTEREYVTRHNKYAEQNTLIDPVPDNFITGNMNLPWSSVPNENDEDQVIGTITDQKNLINNRKNKDND